MRRLLLLILLAALSNDLLLAQSPNVLLVIIDDVGNGPIPTFEPNGANQVKASMPNLEALIEGGLSFDNLWVNPSCSPTRASILTGKYGFRTGVIEPGNHLSTSEYTLFQALNEQSESNYAKALIGKWHLSPGGNNANLDIPYEFGVDYFAGLLGGGIQNYYNWSLIEDGVNSNQNVYATRKFTNLAIDWIEQQEQPWFCWLAYTSAHTPLHVPPANTHNQGDLPNDEASIDANPLPYFIAMIENLDFELGRIKDSMTPSEWENTVVIFIGDNGTPRNLLLAPYDSSPGHGKGSCYQSGVNTPMVIAGPGIERANQRENALINGTDLFSTILSICGASADDYEDSRSFDPLFTDPNNAARDCLFSETGVNNNSGNTGWAIRNEQYKYLLTHNGQEFFFDLLSDPYENNNLINSMTDTQQSAFNDLINKQLSLTTGISEDIASAFYSYPNPVSDILFVEPNIDQAISYSILNLQGQLIQAGILLPEKNELDLSTISSGIYILKVPGFASRLIKR